ncbi:hypothetical protein JI664_00550 [Rhodobacter sp. NTK016B]|uniref:hypothetical protein n=1 Tax=Rhodobacter sp. NTK016B TaxID=2759676 RepID=UPI001A8C8032|nr:hypothetical protein [Rhodobacter sp. NTK016B]MBN8290444.1 hypothetical protein [Rhodobacter sp. NTK016B]
MRVLLMIACLAPLPAFAEAGIAFVQAPEMSSGMAAGASRGEAIDAAIAECVAGGAMEEDCIVTNWCAPAGWSIDIFAQHREGLHWHEVVCGLPTRAVGEMVAQTMCDRGERPELIECQLVQVYDHEGTPQMEY